MPGVGYQVHGLAMTPNTAIMPSFGDFLYTQLILRIPKPTASFASKTVIITGASSGLGKEAAKHIARLGASKIILGCRSISKGEKAKLEIESTVRCSPNVLEVWQVDIESPPSMTEFVARVNQLPRLDVVINNAGIQTINYQVAYGTERTLAVNVIGTFLLALQLIPKLKETAKVYKATPRMTFVSSALYDVAKYPDDHGDDIFTWFNDKSHAEMMNQYNLSKLLLTHAIIKLSSLVHPVSDDKSSNQIVINSLDPCFCKTDLASELSGGLKVFFKVFESLFARSADEGSRLVVQTASAGRESHGGYFRAAELRGYIPSITSVDGARRREYIWEVLSRKLEKLQPGIMANVDNV
ncbi:NAD(P)-binding protein [Aspergillus lucknowensis]|uniref:NAD(P)-binding protein n=1 Tax=Aspergillus lucknowensis TaxID=176173 RepID=A0ABR4LS65_9EURO